MEGTFSTGNMCEPQCVVTGDCPWGTGSDEVVNVAMCADQAEHWVNFEHLFSTLDLDNFWNYHGSLTTPPCSEVVDWYVLMSPALMSESQFMKLRMATGEVATNGNFRPPQSINGRVPEGCTMYSSPWIGKADAPAHTYPYDQDDWYNAVEDAHAVCAVGKHQSPINLDACAAKEQPEMIMDWDKQAVSLALDSGLKITPSGSASSMLKGTTYTLQHCNWHLGSEHSG
jgi:carbonic anhydrase